MSDVRNLRAMFEQQAKAPPPVAAKPVRDRSKTLELQRKLEMKAETEMPTRPSPITLPGLRKTTIDVLPSSPGTSPSNGSPATKRTILTRSASEQPTTVGSPVSTAANDRSSSASSILDAKPAIAITKSAPVTPHPPVVKPRPVLTRSNSVGNGIRQRLNTLGVSSGCVAECALDG